MKRKSIPIILFLLSLLTVTVLLSVTDFSAHERRAFDNIPPDERVKLVSALVEWEKTDNGWLLSLQDVQGDRMDGFYGGPLDQSVLYEGKIVEVVGSMSGGPDDFFFIETIS